MYLPLYVFRFTQGDLAAIFYISYGLLEVHYLHSIKMHNSVTKPKGGCCSVIKEISNKRNEMIVLVHDVFNIYSCF